MNYKKIIKTNFKPVNLPFISASIKKNKSGDLLALNGEIIVARDQAHLKISELYSKNKNQPCDFKNSVIFYAGPSPTPKGKIIGAIGPTTSARMDKFTEMMLKLGVNGFIGKGPRSSETIELIRKNNALYLVTFGGYAALLSQFIIKSEIIAFEELGAEALLKLTVKNFPVVIM